MFLNIKEKTSQPANRYTRRNSDYSKQHVEFELTSSGADGCITK